MTDHFTDTTKMVTVGSDAKRTVKDYILSRFACYLIAQNGDPEKPEIAAAQAYFAIAARTNELREFANAQNERVAVRELVTEHYKILNETARTAGVLPASFGKFHNAGYKAMYGGLDVNEIKHHKGIAPKEDLLDRAGRVELAANLFRVTQTEQKISNDGIIGQQAAINAHSEVGSIVRKAIKETGGTLPEDLPTEPNIKSLIEERKRARKKAVQPKEQANLFGEPGISDNNDSGAKR